MIKLVLHRCFFALLTLALVAMIVFFLTEALPGDACTAFLGREVTPERLAGCREERGLNRPAIERFGAWMGGMTRGDLGLSMTRGEPIRELLGVRFRNSVVLGSMAALIGIPLAILLGVLAGLWRDRPIDVMLSSLSIAAMTIPEFVTATILIYVFSITLNWFPAITIVRTNVSVLELLPNIWLPIITLVTVLIAHILRLVRTSIIEEMGSEYVRMATFKGVPYWRIVFFHALPNAMLPTITIVALTVAWLLGGVVIIEAVFNYPGVGTLLINAIYDRDLPLVQSIALVLAVIYIGMNLLADLLTLAFNPRLRTART